MVKPSKYAEGRRTTKKMVCRVCLKDHPLRFCRKFLQVEYEERMRLVSIYRYCAGCLSHDHTWRTCESTGKCKRCGDMHHTLLHKGGRPSTSARKNTKRLRRGPSSSNRHEKKGPSSSDNSVSGPRSPVGHDDERPSTSQALVLSSSKNRHTRPREKSKRSQRIVNKDIMTLPVLQIREAILLKPTAIIRLEAAGRFVNERVLIDPSAACSVVSDELVRRISGRRVRVANTERCFLKLGGQYGSSATIETYAEIRKNYRIVTPAKSIESKIVDEFPGLQLADPQFNVAAPVMMMIGGDVYSQIIRNGIYGGTLGKPLAQFSIFGYLISGPCSY